MSATMTVPEQLDGLERLITLASLRKEDVIATHQEIRKQTQLDEETLAKAQEAKSYIVKYDSLVAELQAQKEALADEKTKHELDVKQHATHVASENTRLETYEAQVAAREKEFADITSKQLAEADRLRGLGIDQTRQHQETMSALQHQEATNTAVAQANAVEAERLKNWEATLKDKARKIREQAANF